MTAAERPESGPDRDRPGRRPEVVCCEVLDEMVVYCPGTSDAVALNDSARAIWMLCDGTRTAEEICAELAAEAGLPAAQLQADVSGAIDRLRSLGLLEGTDR